MDLYEIAAQILLEEKELADFDNLSEDEKAKLVSILRRGHQTLDQKSVKASMARKRQVREILKAPEKGLTHSYRAFEDQSEEDLSKLTSQVSFQLFPLEKLEKESQILQRKCMEALSRRFSPKELAQIFIHFPEQKWPYRALSSSFLSEIKEFLEKEAKDLDLESIFARYCVAMSMFLSEVIEISPSLRQFVKEYKESLKEELEQFCKKLAEKLGILERFYAFDEMQWRRFAGLYPRVDMAYVAQFLPEDIFNKLLMQIPKQQKKEVLEILHFNEREKKEHLNFYVDLMHSMKKILSCMERMQD